MLKVWRRLIPLYINGCSGNSLRGELLLTALESGKESYLIWSLVSNVFYLMVSGGSFDLFAEISAGNGKC